MLNIGKNIVEGIWNGISNAGQWLWSKISGFCSNIVKNIKNFFGIKSPSKVFNQEVGRYLALGLGKGFNDNLGKVYKQMRATVDFETQKLSTNITMPVVAKNSRDNAKNVSNDNSKTIHCTQNFYEKNPTPYEEQKQAKQQLRRLAYGL